MADRIQLRRDTKANWEAYNPILLEGEPGHVLDDPNLYKMGDGIHAWNDLPYRGYNGTVTSDVQNDVNSVPSGAAVNSFVPNIVHTQDEFLTVGYLYTETGGDLYGYAKYRTSNYIKVDSHKKIKICLYQINTYVICVVFYDSQKNKISYVTYPSLTDYLIDIPAGAVYVRVSCNIDYTGQYIEIIEADTENELQNTPADVIIDNGFIHNEMSDHVDLSGITEYRHNTTNWKYVFFRKDKTGNIVKSVSSMKNNNYPGYVCIVTVDAVNHATYEAIREIPKGSGLYTIDFEKRIYLKENQYIGIIGATSVGNESAEDCYALIISDSSIQYISKGNGVQILYSVKYEDVEGLKVVSDGTDLSGVTEYTSPTGLVYIFFRKDKKSNIVKSVSALRNATIDIHICIITVDAAEENATYEEIGIIPPGNGLYTIQFGNYIHLQDNQYIGNRGITYMADANAKDLYYISTRDSAIIKQTAGNGLTNLYSVNYIVPSSWSESEIEPVIKEIKPYINSIKIYTVCNDILASLGTSLGSRNYSSKVHIDHFYKDLNEYPKIRVENKKNYMPFYSLYEIGYQTKYINSSTNGETLDLNINTENVKVVGNDSSIKDELLTINHISTRNKATTDKHVRLLCIGDSVTAGAGAGENKPYDNAPECYWEWVQALFEMDKIENGNSGFDCLTLGNYLNLPNDVYGGSWQTLTKKIFDINFNGLTKSGVRACAVAKAGANAQWFLANNSDNVFWDDENSKFSILSWLSKYRTLIVNQDGTTSRCDNSNKGSLVTDVNAYDVCEPTHVLIALGYNGRYDSEGTSRTNYLNAINTIIQTIRTELPNAYILLHLPDTAGTYFPELYSEYMQESNDLYSLDFTKGIAKTTHNQLCFMNKDLIDLEDINNKIFYVPSYFVSPLCYGSGYRSADEVGYLSSRIEQMRQNVEAGTNGPYLHPNNTAHACWAYQIYSLIKYTLIL